MPATDLYVLAAVDLVLIALTALAVARDVRVRRREREGGVTATVARGEKSMAALYTVYGGSTASLLVLVDKASGVDGHRAVLIVLNLACLTYLFFFSTWFRNAIFFRIAARIRRD